ncbi:hypothetical protein FXO38_22484 [Capsicum annuum]|uniref:RNA 2-O ribose methyltransferase substrate binding domain-containing protein n=1 Tax=Capsicum annuum TaxID=4072 RepID=A0A2G3A5D7_CAPAN|nr:hypothetical protein FXO38_22484 [Capsicum annuum]KAF3654473.1 hypothetical protein FXO37_16461 [Capsicum annuum]PHT89428.1 hypothetical protein T459_04541 [Capsicum annuum]
MVYLRKGATKSTLPRMVGEGIYGVDPVLAASSSGRREFFGLYIQKGLDLSGNNRKKKDKKGFKRVMMIADKVGLGKKKVSKHDLNMITDNRPHQGLVLDASPLEMVAIKELEPIVPAAPTILVLGNEETELRPLVESSDTELVRILENISVDIIAGQDEYAECDNSISGQNYRSFMAVESLNISVAAGKIIKDSSLASLKPNSKSSSMSSRRFK